MEEIDNLIQKLIQDSGKDIPGLDEDLIMNLLVEKNLQLQSVLQETESIDEKNEIINRFKDIYKTYVSEQIGIIKLSYASLLEGIENIKNNIEGAIKTTLIPPSLSAPPSAPNPLYALAENKQKIASIQIQLSSMNSYLLIILQSSKNINFPLPESITSIFSLINNIKNLINNIPV